MNWLKDHNYNTVMGKHIDIRLPISNKV